MSNGTVFLVKAGFGQRTPVDEPPPAQQQITWSVSVGATEIDEGEVSPNITISRNLNGNPHQDASIKFNTFEADEFDALFPGEDMANAVAGQDFTTWVEPPLEAACAAAGIGYFFDTQENVFVLSWTSGSANSVSFTRQSKVRVGVEDPRRAPVQIYTPSTGALATPVSLLGRDVAVASFVINNTDVVAGLTLNAVARPYTLRRTVAVAGETVFSVSASAGAIASVSFASSVESQGGRFAVVSAGGGVWNIVTTSVPCSFEGDAVTPLGATYGIICYAPTVHVVGTLGELTDLTVEVFPTYPQITALGNQTATVNSITDLTSFRLAAKSSANNVTHRITAATTGILKNDGFSYYSIANDTTFDGHRDIALRTGRALDINGKRRVYRDLCIRVGKHLSSAEGGPTNPDIIRGMNIGEVSQLSQQTTDIWVENCSISLGIDQAADIFNDQTTGPFPRRIVFYRCIFSDPEYSGKSSGPHPFGPLVFRYGMEILFIDCIFLGFKQRSPAIDKSRGVLVQNCIIIYFAAGWGQYGTTFQGPLWDLNSEGTSTILRGNLYHNALDIISDRQRAIGLVDIGTGHRIQANFGNPPYENHFIGDGNEPPHFESDPLSLAGNVKDDTGTSTTAAFVDYDPFQLAHDYGYLPTTTEANREAVYERTIRYAGCRKRVGGVPSGALIPGNDALSWFDKDALDQYETLGTMRTFDYPPDGAAGTVEARYGWDTDNDGSLGHPIYGGPP